MTWNAVCWILVGQDEMTRRWRGAKSSLIYAHPVSSRPRVTEDVLCAGVGAVSKNNQSHRDTHAHAHTHAHRHNRRSVVRSFNISSHMLRWLIFDVYTVTSPSQTQSAVSPDTYFAKRKPSSQMKRARWRGAGSDDL